MNQGVAVCSLSSALSRQEEADEEKRAYLLGRNALFQTIDEASPLSCEAVFIADSFRTKPDESQGLQNRIRRLIHANICKKTRRMIVLSSLEAAGKDTSVSHGRRATAEREAARAMEAYLISSAGEKAMIFFRTRRSEMCRRGSQASRYMAAFYFADCHGLSRWSYDPDVMNKSETNKNLYALLGEPEDGCP
jgi:hypothetical protein